MRWAALLLLAPLCARAEEEPLAPGVTVELRAERTEFALGDPVLVDVTYRNGGQEAWEAWEPLGCGFQDDFEVHDARGAKVPNPFADLDYGGYDGPIEIHKLPPGGTVTVRRYVNGSAAFEKPGEYVVTARAEVWGGLQNGVITKNPRCKSGSLRIRILPAPDKKTRDAIVADLKALSHDTWGKLREQAEYQRYRPYVTESNCAHDALRLLAFRRDQELLPFWIGLFGRDGGAYAEEALAGLPDRAAVLKALEDRLAQGERDDVLRLYTCLAAPRTDNNEWQGVQARREEIRKRYERK